MEFRNRQKTDLLGRPMIEASEGDETIKGERARVAARALAVVGSEWKKDFYIPNLDRDALAQLEEYLIVNEGTMLDEALKLQLQSALIHLRRVIERENLANEFFEDGLDAMNIKQANRGTCYLLAPLIALHRKPELLWALLPEIIEKTGEKSCVVKFPSAQYRLGSLYPPTRDLKDYKTELAKWVDENKTEGSLGDLAIESRYASMIAKGRSGMEMQTMRVNTDGSTYVDGGHSEVALSTMFPPEYITATPRRLSSSFPAIGHIKSLLNDPRKMSFFSNHSVAGRSGKVKIGDVEIFKHHAYAMGELKNNMVRFYNPHDPKQEMWVTVKDLYADRHSYISTVELNYRAAPLMDHVRMIEGLPSEEYQVRYLQNLIFSSRDEIYKLLMIPEGASISLAIEEFLLDMKFGPLFRKAKLEEFIIAHESKSPYPFTGFTMPREKPRTKTNPMAMMGCSFLLASLATCAGVVDFNRENLSDGADQIVNAFDHRNCLDSVPGTWTFKRGDDVLAKPHDRGDQAMVLVFSGDEPVEIVTNYPFVCLDGQASHGVAAHLPVHNDSVQVYDQETHESGNYSFKPNIDLDLQRKLSAETSQMVDKTSSFWTVTVQCLGGSDRPVLQGCMDDMKY